MKIPHQNCLFAEKENKVFMSKSFWFKSIAEFYLKKQISLRSAMLIPKFDFLFKSFNKV